MTIQQLKRLLEVIIEIGKAIGSQRELEPLLSDISKHVCQLFMADACSIMLLHDDRELRTVAAFGLAPERMHLIAFQVGEGIAGWVMGSGRPALISDVFRDGRYAELPISSGSDERGAESMMCVPLLSRGRKIGVMTLTARGESVFAQDDIDVLGAIANTIAMNIENTHLQRMSITDPLTGAFNRQYLRENLPRAIEATRRRGLPLSIAMVDVDHFKSINDEYGHKMGDRVLVSVAKHLRSAIRDDDMLVRYGGEEFLIVLPKADQRQAWEIGERMRVKLQNEPVNADGTMIPVRISVGIAEHRRHGRRSEHGDRLIHRADQAMYMAKIRGRNRVEVSTPPDEEPDPTRPDGAPQ